MQTSAPVPRVVIVGGGFGGLSAAKALRKAPVHVTVIDRNNHHLFQPLLYQVATAGLSPANIASPIRSILRKQRNVDVVMAEVTGVDRERRFVKTTDRLIPYDTLILATGAHHSYFGHDHWEAFAPGLKSVTDATRLRRRILQAFEAAETEADPDKRQSWLTFTLVGAGPTGVEMAGAIAELAFFALCRDFRHVNPADARILLVEANSRILKSFPEKLSEAALKELRKLGVEVMTNARVEDVDATGVIVSGKRVSSRTVIWTAGVMASAAARWLHAESDRSGRVKVEPDLTVPGNPDIFVIGDTALALQDGQPLPGVAPVAMQQGRYVAGAIRGRLAGKKELAPFHYVDKGALATVGRRFAIAEFAGFSLSGFFAWLTWLVVHIYYLIGFRNRMLVMIQWAWAYLTYHRGARLITGAGET